MADPSMPHTSPAAMSNGARMLLFAVMALGMFMSLLDVQIVAASLPEITSGLAAGADQSSWLQTSYLIAEIVMIPLSGFLAQAFSTRWLFTASAAAFTVSSVACGFAWNIESAIVFRAVQGFVGGAMIPTVFATGFTIFTGRQQALIPAILGLTGTVAPILGPTFGGWITDVLSWRWLFFINVAPGLLICALVPALCRIDEAEPDVLRGFDASGLAAMALFLGGLQYVLEEGPRRDWLADPLLRGVAIASALGAVTFVRRSFTHPRAVIDLRLFGDARFVMGCLFQFVLGIGMFSAIYLIPQYLARVQEYRSLDIGQAVFITGVAQISATPLSAVLSRRIDPRHMIVFGFSLFGLSFLQLSRLSSDWGGHELLLPQAMRGFATMFCIVPATNMALGSMPPTKLKAASGLSNLMRNLGGAIGIALSNTIVDHRYQLHFSRLADSLRASRLDEWLASAQAATGGVIADAATRQPAAMALLVRTVNREALTMAYADCALLFACGFFATLVIIPLSRRMPAAGAGTRRATTPRAI
ncbi:MAG: DHA2 family efflux MFS transporter permease subunit [Solimonas sp.]